MNKQIWDRDTFYMFAAVHTVVVVGGAVEYALYNTLYILYS